MVDIRLEAAGRTSQCSLPLPPPSPPSLGPRLALSRVFLRSETGLGPVRAMCAGLLPSAAKTGDHRAPQSSTRNTTLQDGSHVSSPAVSLMDAGNELGEDDTHH